MSENKRNKLIKHFSKYDLVYFIQNININAIDYKKFFNCL